MRTSCARAFQSRFVRFLRNDRTEEVTRTRVTCFLLFAVAVVVVRMCRPKFTVGIDATKDARSFVRARSDLRGPVVQNSCRAPNAARDTRFGGFCLIVCEIKVKLVAHCLHWGRTTDTNLLQFPPSSEMLSLCVCACRLLCVFALGSLQIRTLFASWFRFSCVRFRD